MNAKQTPHLRPFCSLDLKPFLLATPQDLEKIKSFYIEKSRQLHPDRYPSISDEQKEALENELAELNHDYLRLKDPLKLTGEIVSANCPSSHSSLEKIPPDLAAKYFELQEIWEEKGTQDPGAKQEAQSLLKEVEIKKSTAQNALFDLAGRFPYEGQGLADPKWTLADLETMRHHLHIFRYYQSFSKDIESKYGHSN